MAMVSVLTACVYRHYMVEKEKGRMTVEEAGRLGGEKGGQRVKKLIEEGKQLEKRKEGRKR
jgi:hypothetical protein